jgi:hypothetical protein
MRDLLRRETIISNISLSNKNTIADAVDDVKRRSSSIGGRRRRPNLKSVRKERMWAGRISVLVAGGAGSA